MGKIVSNLISKIKTQFKIYLTKSIKLFNRLAEMWDIAKIKF